MGVVNKIALSVVIFALIACYGIFSEHILIFEFMKRLLIVIEFVYVFAGNGVLSIQIQEMCTNILSTTKLTEYKSVIQTVIAWIFANHHARRFVIWQLTDANALVISDVLHISSIIMSLRINKLICFMIN